MISLSLPVMRVARTLLVSAAVVAMWCGVIRAEVPVEGDRELLTTLIAAEKANLEALKRGRMRVKASWTQYSESGGKQIEAAGEATALWDGERQRWEYSANVEIDDPALGHSYENTNFVFIKTPVEIITYIPGKGDVRGVLRVRPVSRRTVNEPFARARPQKWFVFGGHDRGNWSEHFDPANERGKVTGIEVHQVGDRIVVKRSYSDKHHFVIEASLAQGGNVVQYKKQTRFKTKDGPDERIETGSYVWAQDKSDVWYLKKCHYQSTPADEPDRLRWEFNMEALEFSSTPEVRDFDFGVASIEAAQGDRIEIRNR